MKVDREASLQKVRCEAVVNTDADERWIPLLLNNDSSISSSYCS